MCYNVQGYFYCWLLVGNGGVDNKRKVPQYIRMAYMVVSQKGDPNIYSNIA